MREHKYSEEEPSERSRSKEQEEAAIEEIADLVLESLAEDYKTEGEPFEVYAQKLKSHIHTDSEVFKHRFTQGYELMMEILRKPEIEE